MVSATDDNRKTRRRQIEGQARERPI